MSSEGFIPLNGSGGNSAPVTGGRRGRSQKKLRTVKKSTVRRMLKAKGLKMRGGMGGPTPPPASPPVGGRRRKSRGTRRRRRSVFGMRY